MNDRIRAALACMVLTGLAGCESQRAAPTKQAAQTVEPVRTTRPATLAAVTRPTSQPISASTTKPVAKAFNEVADQKNLENAHYVTDKLISGAQPEGEASFKLLQEMGVKTIISVDGAKPDVELAHKYGMTYVHLPIGYDGVGVERGKQIAKAIDEKEGPIYLHCHHGKHRSAGAVAVACVFNGTLKPEQAESVLQTFGTGANYKGLWKDAREAKPLDPAELKAVKVDYVETAKIPPTAEAMVAVEVHWHHLKLTQKAGWSSPKEHPDLDPAHEALQLEELLHEMRRLDSAHGQVPDYLRLLTEGEEGSKSLKVALSAKPIDKPGADAAFKRIAASCSACHKAHRD